MVEVQVVTVVVVTAVEVVTAVVVEGDEAVEAVVMETVVEVAVLEEVCGRRDGAGGGGGGAGLCSYLRGGQPRARRGPLG